MNKIRKISPFLSVILALLMFAGSTGFTIVKHQCFICGHQEMRSSVGLALSGDVICCNHEADNHSQNQNSDDFIIDNDGCSHETEKMISEDVVRSEVQPDIIPYFIAAVQVSILYPDSEQDINAFHPERIFHCGRDLTTLHCQILS